MSNVVPIRATGATKNMHICIPPIDLEAAVAVSRYVSLRQGPVETPSQFVTRIVRAYKAEGGK